MIKWPLGFQSQHGFEEVVQAGRIFLDAVESFGLELPWNVRLLTAFPAVDLWFSRLGHLVGWSEEEAIRDGS